MGSSSSKKESNLVIQTVYDEAQAKDNETALDKKRSAFSKKPSISVHAFKSKKDIPAGSKQQKMSDNLNQTMYVHREKIQAGLDAEPILKEMIKLPEGEKLNDWLGVNTIHFYNIASMVYGTTSKFCSDQSCPEMSAGPKYQYFWADGVKVKDPIAVSARSYMTYLFDWIEDQIADPTKFPVDDSTQYPENYREIVKSIYKRLFRMYGHVYYSHFDQIRAMGAEAHLNASFQHFMYFVLEYHLVEDFELKPLTKLISKLVPGYR